MLEGGLVAVVRSADNAPLGPVVEALVDGGVSVVEVTFTVPNALEQIAAITKQFGERVLVGAGTVLDPETGRAALAAGAQFLVSPTLNLDTVRLCRRYGQLAVPGAFTPTEILTAWEAGADIVKVFPADVLGPAFIKAVKAPLPQVRLMPTGGVDLKNASEYLRSGACCIGVGSQMVDPKAVARHDYEYLRGVAWQYTQAVRLARGTE
jgi:2-dehydro-3-deoxyphosphogluconate aldolase/(4S)-4-hydroxy-2-oxoglutarate aldolase